MNDTLYITDLDGTLLDSSSQVSERSADLLNRAIASGAMFSIATARTPATVAPLMAKVNLQIPCVLMTGVVLWDRNTGRYSNVKHFDPEVVENVRRVYEECRLPYFLYTLRDGVIEIFHRGPLNDTERNFIADRLTTPYKHFEIPADGNSVIPESVDNALLFFAMQPSEPAREAYGKMLHVKGVNPIFYFDPTYGEGLSMSEAFPAGATKAAAARSLADSIGAGRIVAFGDNINDIPLLREADVAVAVGNALPEVKEIADIVIGSHDDDAVAEFILSDHLGRSPRATLLSL